MTDTHDKKAIEEMTFEEKTYAYARAWAQMNRRDFLKAGAALGGTAAFAGLSIPSANAAKPGGTLRIARGQESDTLDPQKTTLLVAHEIAWQIYDSLIYLDEAGTVYPGLATSWEFSNEGKTVTFKLREGVNFHDGSPFNAEVVRWTVERHRAETTASPTSWMLGPIEGTEVIDDMTIAYHYTDPFVPLWVGLGYSYCAPISKAAVEERGDAFGRNPSGTGPFKFVRWDPDQGIELVRNDEHNWATPWYSNEGKAYLERVEYLVIPEDATRLAALLSGDVDCISGTEAVPVDKLRQIEATEGYKIYSRPAVGVFFAMFNHKMAPLDDVRVRQALNYAVNRDKIIALVLDGQGQPAFSPVASSYAQYNPETETYGFRHDLEKAKALMAEAGLADGFTMSYLNIESPIFRRVAEVIQEDLSQINVSMEIESYAVAEWFALGGQGKFHTSFFYYTYSDPDLIYPMMLTGAGLNWTFSENADLDVLIEAQRIEFDAEKRAEQIRQIQEVAVKDAYWLYLYEGTYVAAMKEEVQGLELNLVGFHHLQDVWLDV